jgi:hypothetical protein
MFLILNFDLKYLERLQSSETLLTKMPQTFCFFSTLGVWNPYWLAQLHLMKKAAKVLHYFSLDCVMLEFFKYSTHEPSSKEQC